MLPALIDSHCHLDAERFDADREQVLTGASEAGVSDIVVPAIRAADWSRIKALVSECTGLHALYGLHPMFLAQHQASDLEALRDWLERSPDAAGVGECGLDRSGGSTDDDLAQQMQYFVPQLEIARDHGLPVAIHARGAVEQVIDALRVCRSAQGMVHSYNGSYQQATRLIDMGFMLGFGGAMTYTRAKKLRKLVAQLPLDALLLETDAPDQPGALHTGMRNEPGFLREVFDVICALRSETPELIAATTSQNARRLFSFPD